LSRQVAQLRFFSQNIAQIFGECLPMASIPIGIWGGCASGKETDEVKPDQVARQNKERKNGE
jgi:hypothetical protein